MASLASLTVPVTSEKCLPSLLRTCTYSFRHARTPFLSDARRASCCSIHYHTGKIGRQTAHRQNPETLGLDSVYGNPTCMRLQSLVYPSQADCNTRGQVQASDILHSHVGQCQGNWHGLFRSNLPSRRTPGADLRLLPDLLLPITTPSLSWPLIRMFQSPLTG